MTTAEVAVKLTEYCRQGQNMDAIAELYSPDIVSIEPAASDALPARSEGIEAVRGKNQWWLDNHDIHEATVQGPWVNHDRFIVRYRFEVTPKNGERFTMEEIAVYTVNDGRIVMEEFFY